MAHLSPGDAYACVHTSAAGDFVARLPSWRVPVEFGFDDTTRLVDSRPDTLILEPGPRRVLLIARTSVPLPRKLTALREIQGRQAFARHNL